MATTGSDLCACVTQYTPMKTKANTSARIARWMLDYRRIVVISWFLL
jgi:hypothetical protein